MMEIFLAVKIECCKKIVVVPVDFIYKLDFVKTFNNSLNRNQKHLMYWSQDQNKEPNFDLPVSEQFNHSIDGCYYVKLLKAFRKFIKMCKSLVFEHKRFFFIKTIGNQEESFSFSQRRVFDPALYNERRLHEKPYPMTNAKRANVPKASTSKAIESSKPQRPKPYPTTNPTQANVPKATASKALTSKAIKSSKPAEKVQNKVPPQCASPPQSVHQAKRSQRLVTTDDVADVLIDTARSLPISTSDQDLLSSNDDVICLTPNVGRLKPFADFDVISGRYAFTIKKVYLFNL